MAENKDPEAGLPVTDEAAEDPIERKKGMKMIKGSTPSEKASTGLAVGAAGVSISSLLVAPTLLVGAAGAATSGMGGYAAHQQRQITDIQALKETLTGLQMEVDQLEFENKRLGGNVDDLTNTVDRLEDVEEAFKTLTQTQGQNVKSFADQVEENKEILAKMKKNFRSSALQNLLSIIIKCDEDHSLTIDEEETEGLIRKIKNTRGIILREDALRDTLRKSGGSLDSVIGAVKNLMMDKSVKNPIFTIKHCD